MKKRVLLIGGKSKAKSLALSLKNKGYSVTIINESHEECLNLSLIEGINVIEGDGTKPFILDEAEAGECDISIALTPNDEDNLVASELCKKRFHVKKTVSILSDPKKTDFFREMGIDSVVCAISTITNIIEHQAFLDEISSCIPIGEGRVQIVEVQIHSDSPANSKKIWELTLPEEVIIGCILRAEATIIPRGDTRILAGDILVVIAQSGKEIETVRALNGRLS